MLTFGVIFGVSLLGKDCSSIDARRNLSRDLSRAFADKLRTRSPTSVAIRRIDSGVLGIGILGSFGNVSGGASFNVGLFRCWIGSFALILL